MVSNSNIAGGSIGKIEKILLRKIQLLTYTIWTVVVILLVFIFELLRRKVIREKYAVVWLVLGFTLMFGIVFPDSINKLSQLLGFQFLSNFVLFVFVVINLMISMQLTLSLGKAENQIQNLTEELALTKFDLKE